MGMIERPTLPVRHVYTVRKGPFWKTREVTVADEYSSWEAFFGHIEMLDTFGDESQWLEDSRGERWDVRINALWGGSHEDCFQKRL